MYVSGINNNVINKPKIQNNRNNVSFGYKILVDSGASDPHRGSFKIKIVSDDGKKVLLQTDGIPESLEKVGPEGGFITAKDYVDGLSNNIVSGINLVKDKITELKEKLTGVCVNVPCYVRDNKAKIVANIKDHNDQSILDIDFKTIKDNLQKAGVEISEDNFKLLATNDLAGAAAGIAQIMARSPKYNDLFKEGFFGSIWMTGGGTGVADIKIKNGILEIETSESGHNRAIQSKKDRSIEKYGGSSPALIRNYCKALGMKDKDIKTLLNVGKAKIVTQFPVKLDKGSEAEKIFMNTGLFKITGEKTYDQGRTRVLLQLKGVNNKDHKKASITAIDKYMKSLAQIASNKILEGANCIILTGPMALRIREQVNKDSDKYWDGKTFDEMVTNKTIDLLDQTGIKTMQIHDFKIISDIDIPDNTVGGEVLLSDNTKFIAEKLRGNWINVPLKNLNY